MRPLIILQLRDPIAKYLPEFAEMQVAVVPDDDEYLGEASKLVPAPASVGSYSWGGACRTVFRVDPDEELIGVLMTQVRPRAHLNIRQDLQTLTYPAIVD